MHQEEEPPVVDGLQISRLQWVLYFPVPMKSAGEPYLILLSSHGWGRCDAPLKLLLPLHTSLCPALMFSTVLLRPECHHTVLEQGWSFKRLDHFAAVGFLPTRLALSPDLIATLPVPDEAKSSTGVNEDFGGIELVERLQLGCSIIPWECVVPVVPAFTHGEQGYPAVLCGSVGSVVRLGPPSMHHRVDRPSGVEEQAIAQNATKQETVPHRVTPQQSHEGWEGKAPEEVPKRIHFLLEHHNRVRIKIFAVHLSSRCINLWAFLQDEPSNVREPEAKV